MDVAAFLVLYISSFFALIAAGISHDQPVKIPTHGQYRLMLVWGVVCVGLSYILASSSSLSIRYAILAYMVISLFIDAGYYRWVMKKHDRFGGIITQRRQWWPIVDNTMWVVLTIALFAT